jgi:hypothetical protein
LILPTIILIDHAPAHGQQKKQSFARDKFSDDIKMIIAARLLRSSGAEAIFIDEILL